MASLRYHLFHELNPLIQAHEGDASQAEMDIFGIDDWRYCSVGVVEHLCFAARLEFGEGDGRALARAFALAFALALVVVVVVVVVVLVVLALTS